MLIKKISTENDLMKFIKFPWEIYKSDQKWVPQLIGDYKYNLTKYPYWEHAEKELFMAYNDSGKAVGRIAAIIDHNFIRFHDEPVGFFGFFETINDVNVAKEMLDAVKKYLKSKGLSIMRGPMNPSSNDECGFLCEGFDTMPRLMMPYNPPYYLELMEKCGLKKAKELYAYEMDPLNSPRERLERLEKITFKKNEGLKIRTLNINDFKNELQRTLSIYNAAWEKNWGFVPWTEKEYMAVATKMKDLFEPRTTIMAEIGNKPVGMLIVVPDYNFVLQKMDGKLLPFGLFKFLYYKSKIKAGRLMIMGVIKEYRQKGIEGAMYLKALQNCLKLGYEKIELSWILDDNIMTQRACEMMGGKIYKKYRIYETAI